VPDEETATVAGVPPGMPFTLHVTLMFVVLLTVAVSVCELPRRTVPVVGVMETPISGGGGGGS
jgi:hypothetical protein